MRQEYPQGERDRERESRQRKREQRESRGREREQRESRQRERERERERLFGNQPKPWVRHLYIWPGPVVGKNLGQATRNKHPPVDRRSRAEVSAGRGQKYPPVEGRSIRRLSSEGGPPFE